MANNLKELSQTDFSGGLNAVTNPYRLSMRQIYRARNLTLDEHGSLRTRDGYSLVSTSTDITNPIVHLGVLNTTNGNSYGFAVQNDGSINTLRRTDTSTWSSVGSTFTAYTIPDSTTVIDKQVFAMGYESPWTWDGTTFEQITAAAGQTVPPGAKHLAFHLGSLWLWNTNGTTTTLDGPSSLRMADANSTTSWPNANQSFISKDDGQVGMGMATFTIVETGISPTATLVLFKNYSGYQVTGVFGASNFATQKIKSDMGCVAPRTIQFVSGFGIIRLGHKGFALFNGVDDRLISEEVRPYIFGHDDLAGLNWQAIDRSYATQSQNPPLYIAACPVTGTSLTRFFVYDLVRKAWTICDLPFGVQSMTLFTTPTTLPEPRAGRTSSGQIVRVFGGDTTDSGTAINWSMQSRTFTASSQLRPAYWRRFLMSLLFAPAQAATVNTTLMSLGAALASTVTYNGTQAGSQYGSAIYGQGTYGTSLTNTIDDLQSVDIHRTSPSAFVTVSGTGNVRIRAMGFHVSPKPLTRRVTQGVL